MEICVKRSLPTQLGGVGSQRKFSQVNQNSQTLPAPATVSAWGRPVRCVPLSGTSFLAQLVPASLRLMSYLAVFGCALSGFSSAHAQQAVGRPVDGVYRIEFRHAHSDFKWINRLVLVDTGSVAGLVAAWFTDSPDLTVSDRSSALSFNHVEIKSAQVVAAAKTGELAGLLSKGSSNSLSEFTSNLSSNLSSDISSNSSSYPASGLQAQRQGFSSDESLSRLMSDQRLLGIASSGLSSPQGALVQALLLESSESDSTAPPGDDAPALGEEYILRGTSPHSSSKAPHDFVMKVGPQGQLHGWWTDTHHSEQVEFWGEAEDLLQTFLTQSESSSESNLGPMQSSDEGEEGRDQVSFNQAVPGMYQWILDSMDYRAGMSRTQVGSDPITGEFLLRVVGDTGVVGTLTFDWPRDFIEFQSGQILPTLGGPSVRLVSTARGTNAYNLWVLKAVNPPGQKMDQIGESLVSAQQDPKSYPQALMLKGMGISSATGRTIHFTMSPLSEIDDQDRVPTLKFSVERELL